MSAVRRGSGNYNPDRIQDESFMVSDFIERRIPVPVKSFLAIADIHTQSFPAEDLSRSLIEKLYENLQPVSLTEEELRRETMHELILSAFEKINSFLEKKINQTNNASAVYASLTFAVATRNAAFIGHAGKNRIFLLHDDRLFDLTPTKPPEQEKIVNQTPRLFDNAGQTSNEKVADKPLYPESAKNFSDQEKFYPGYNEVALSFGDILIICSDGMCDSVKEKEIAKVFKSSINVARACNILERLAAKKNPQSSATVVAWKYHPDSIKKTREKRSMLKIRKLRRKLYHISTIIALSLVLLLIFALGFSIGWRITDAFRKPSEETSNLKEIEKRQEIIKTKPPEISLDSSKPAQTQNISSPETGNTVTITRNGVQVRSAPETEGKILGFLAKGESVTVIGSATSSDGKTWYKIRGYVHDREQKKLIEGYIRSDFTKTTFEIEKPGF